MRFLRQAFSLEKFLIDGMEAIRVWFFLILLAFALLFTLEGGREILRWILRLLQLFPKQVRFRYYRILRGLKLLLQQTKTPFSLCQAAPRLP